MTDHQNCSAATADVSLKRIQLFVCQACLDGVGHECHTPGCALYLHRVDLPIPPEVYTIVDVAQSSQVTDAMVERAWAAIVGSDVAPSCFQASIIRADLKTGLQAALAAHSPAAPVETGCTSSDGGGESRPASTEPQASASRRPQGLIGEAGVAPGPSDPQCSAGTAGVYGAESLPPGVSIASANKAIEFLEWLSGYIGHGPAVQINSEQMEYIRSKVHPLVHELDGRAPAQPQGARK